MMVVVVAGTDLCILLLLLDLQPGEARFELVRLNAGRAALTARVRDAKARVWERPDSPGARRALDELEKTRAALGPLFVLMREDKLRLYECDDNEGTSVDVAVDAAPVPGDGAAADDGVDRALRRRLQHAAAGAGADGYFNLRSGHDYATLLPGQMATVLRAFAATPRCAQLGLTGASSWTLIPPAVSTPTAHRAGTVLAPTYSTKPAGA